jgi:iron complex transport system substrate-binding protein
MKNFSPWHRLAMRRSLEILLLLFCCAYLLAPCQAEARMVVDQTGRRLHIPDSPKRVLALAPSLTEMIFSIGAEAKLVGVTHFSDYPPAARNLPRVGSYIQLDLEKIVALRPDLCFAVKDGNPKHAVDAIEALGIPVFAVDPQSIGQIMDTLLVMGDMLDAKKKARRLVADLRQRVDRVRQRVASSKDRPRVFFQIADSPLISAGKDSFIDRLITLAGGINLAGGAEGYPPYSWENIMILQPEVVLISSMTGGENQKQLKEAWLRWPTIPAVRHNRLYVVKADLFNRPTARLIDGLEILADILHPKAAGGNSGK